MDEFLAEEEFENIKENIIKQIQNIDYTVEEVTDYHDPSSSHGHSDTITRRPSTREDLIEEIEFILDRFRK